MIEVTDEMLALLREYQMGAYGEVDDDCDKRMIAALIELHEANKPKPEPVGYTSEKELRLLSMGYRSYVWPDNEEDGCNIPIYTNPPTREPLSEDEINDIIEDVLPHGTMGDLVRAIEQANGIGVTNA